MLPQHSKAAVTSRQLAFNLPESKVDSRQLIFNCFWYLMLPKTLCRSGHQQKRAMMKRNFNNRQILFEFMAQFEHSGFAKANRSNNRILPKIFFFIAVPSNAIATIAVQV